MKPAQRAGRIFTCGRSLADITKSWAGLMGVDARSLDVADGAVVVPLGASGRRKITTMRIGAGLQSFASREVRLGGVRAGDRPPAERDIAMVFQTEEPVRRRCA